MVMRLSGWTQQFDSLVDYYRHFSHQFENHDAFVQFASCLSYGELWDLAQKFACFLQQRNIKVGDRVAIILPNCLSYMPCLMGIHAVGAVAVNLNPEYTAHELQLRLQDAAPQVVIVLDCFAAKLAEVLKTAPVPLVVLATLGDLLPWWKRAGLQFMLYAMQRIPFFHIDTVISFRKAIEIGGKRAFLPVVLNQNDLAFLQYTGGTTGTLKAAMLTHGNLLANLEQAHLLFGDFLQAGKEISVFALPMYHIFCLTINFLLAMGLGVKHIMIVDPRDLNSLIKQVKKFPITMMIGVNTLFDKLIRHPQFASLNLSQLKLVVAGGMAVQASTANQWAALTKVPILQGYGLTETSPVVCMNNLKEPAFNGSVGKPLFATELLFLDDQRQPVKPGEVGEIAVRGPQLMQAYWHQEEETKKVFTAEGYFLTGDMGYQDERGFVFLKERKKDMIDISGLKVYPSEVEEVLMRQAHVLEAAVVGQFLPEGGEAVTAYVVRDSLELSERDLIQACRKELIAYKVPKKIYFCDSLPKNNVGKVLKRELREKLNP